MGAIPQKKWNLMSLQQSSADILTQLVHFIDQLDEQEYAAFLPVLNDSSVGKHIRHIIEFYECLLNGLHSGNVDYDARIRNIVLETDPFFAVQVILDIIQNIDHVNGDRLLKLKLDLSANNARQDEMETTFYRELAYNIEHAIHHMAIIKIAVLFQYPHFKVEENFGVAHSTIRHKQLVNQ